MPKAYEKLDESLFDKQIDVEKKPGDVKQDGYNLPPGFEWANIDIKDKV